MCVIFPLGKPTGLYTSSSKILEIIVKHTYKLLSTKLKSPKWINGLLKFVKPHNERKKRTQRENTHVGS